MTDYGLLLSMALTVGLPSLFVRRWPLKTTAGQSLTDVSISALGVGLIVGRIVNLLLDDPRSLTRLGDFLIIRSGVEFWAGAVAGTVVVARGARRDKVGVADRLADVAPAALVAQAGYHLTCIVRDGCYGPDWAAGPVPKGLMHGMFPVELVAAVVLVAVAVRLASRTLHPAIVALGGLSAIAAERSVTSIWLPRLGAGITRQHTTSIVISSVSAVGIVVLYLAQRRREPLPTPCAT